MRFSIVTPSFNGMPALRRCIGSIRGQILPEAEPQRSEVKGQRSVMPAADPLGRKVSSDLRSPAVAEAMADRPISESESPIRVQHIVQDGGSTDGTVEFLDEYQQAASNQPLAAGEDQIKANNCELKANDYTFSYESAPDNGMYDAINKGWAKSDGDILSWLNCDEQYLPGTLQKVADFFQSHPKADVVFGDMIIVDSSGQPIAARREIDTCKRHVANGVLFIFSGAMFFHRRLFDRGILNFDTAYKLAGDMDLVLKLLSYKVKFFHINEYLSLFGADGGNLTTQYWTVMQNEIQTVRKKYGGQNSLFRLLFLTDRYLKRAFRGCYRKDDVQFTYICDEFGKTIDIKGREVGRDYSL